MVLVHYLAFLFFILLAFCSVQKRSKDVVLCPCGSAEQGLGYQQHHVSPLRQ